MKNLIVFFAIIAVTACTTGTQQVTVGTATQEPATVQPTATEIPTFTPKATRAPTATATPTVPLAIQAFGPPIFVASANINCRSGPDRVYPKISRLPDGQRALILGKKSIMPADLEWWYIAIDNINCWVPSNLGWTYGTLIYIPIVASQPTPTPKP